MFQLYVINCALFGIHQAHAVGFPTGGSLMLFREGGVVPGVSHLPGK
jgi:hypothetical protein